MPERYESTISSYCFDPSAGFEATALDVPAANARMESMLAAMPEKASPSLRRELIAVMLAAGEPGSALVQWLRLPASERRAEGLLTPFLVEIMEWRETRINETDAVAARVAARVGLERLWSVDDQSTYMGELEDREGYGNAMRAIWDNPASTARSKRSKALKDGLADEGGLMAMYRAYNAPDNAGIVYSSDFGAALADTSAPAYGRRYLAYWETRNLRMVANMREILGREPGTRMLTIVGVSHKQYYEAYLAQMRDVRLVDPLQVLSEGAPGAE